MPGRRASSGYVLLEDGTLFEGEMCGAEGSPAVGEVVFNTSMTGYQEAVTDPSYAGQLITFTYPMIGNYGVADQAMESDRIHARAAIMRDARNSEDSATAERGWLDWLRDCGIPAITGSTLAPSSATSVMRARCGEACSAPRQRRTTHAS